MSTTEKLQEFEIHIGAKEVTHWDSDVRVSFWTLIWNDIQNVSSLSTAKAAVNRAHANASGKLVEAEATDDSQGGAAAAEATGDTEEPEDQHFICNDDFLKVARTDWSGAKTSFRDWGCHNRSVVMKCRIAEAIFTVGIDVECYGDISFSGQGHPIVKMMQSDFMLPFYGAVILSSPDSMKTHKVHFPLGSLLVKLGGASYCLLPGQEMSLAWFCNVSTDSADHTVDIEYHKVPVEYPYAIEPTSESDDAVPAATEKDTMRMEIKLPVLVPKASALGMQNCIICRPPFEHEKAAPAVAKAVGSLGMSLKRKLWQVTGQAMPEKAATFRRQDKADSETKHLQ